MKIVYQHFGLEWTEEYEAALKKFLNKNPKGKLGKHNYSAEQFGLSDQTIRGYFAEYIDVFRQYLSCENFFVWKFSQV